MGNLYIGFVLGVNLAYFYDWLRIVRRLKVHGFWHIFVEDLFFFLFAGGLVFFTLQEKCQGILHYYTVLSGLMGIIVYYFLTFKWGIFSVVFTLQRIRRYILYAKSRLTKIFKRCKIILCKRYNERQMRKNKDE